MSNQSVQVMGISGRPGTGLGTMTAAIITGCPARGCCRLRSASSGLQPGGVGVVMPLSSTRVTGALKSVFMAALTMDSATSEWVSKAAVGTTGISFITERLAM